MNANCYRDITWLFTRNVNDGKTLQVEPDNLINNHACFLFITLATRQHNKRKNGILRQQDITTMITLTVTMSI